MDACTPGSCYSVTSAPTKLCVANNSTWSDAYQFGKPDDFTWSFGSNTFEMEVQRSPYDDTPLLSMTTSNGMIVVDDPDQRVLHFNVSPSALRAALRPGVYVYDLVMVDPSDVRTLLMHGTVEIVQGVTFT